MEADAAGQGTQPCGWSEQPDRRASWLRVGNAAGTPRKQKNDYF
jgi:hypothetical protein